MLFRLKLHPRHQLTVFACCVALSALCCYAFDFQPRFRASFLLTLGAASLGIGTAFLGLLLMFLQRRFFSHRFGSPVQKIAKLCHNSSPALMCASALISATGEELLFRGFVLNYAISVSITMALSVNAIVAYIAYYSRETGHTFSSYKAIEATIMALLFWNTSSVFAITIARLLSELVFCFSMRSQRMLVLLSGISLKGTAYEAR